MHRPRPRSRLQRALFGTAFASVLLYLAEVGLRLGGVGPAYRADAIAGWRLNPGSGAQTTHTTREGGSFLLTTNTDGLRTTIPAARTPGVPRVALLGDSTVFGWGVDDGGTLADGLAAGLRARGVHAEVLNAGQPGYSTTQAQRMSEQVLARYAPDLVILFVPMHDDNRVLVSDREHLEGASGPISAARVAIAAHSSLYQALRQVIFPLTEEPSLVPGVQSSPELRVPRVRDAERDDNFDRLRAMTRKWGGTVAVGHLPFLADLEGVAGNERFSVPWAEGYAARTGTPIVDLRGCCVGKGGRSLTLPNDPGHLSAAGNALVGGAAAASVAALLGTPSPAPPSIGAMSGSNR